MRFVTGKTAVAVMLIIATALIVATANAQSCSDGKLCNGNYKVDSYSNSKHKDILIVVQSVGGANPRFTFAQNQVSERLVCDDPDIDNDGEDMSCTKPLDNRPEGCMETVRIGVIGGKFCEALRTLGSFTKVMASDECTDHDDCACFMVKYYWEGDGEGESESEGIPEGLFCADITVGPPTEGTGSGGSP